MRVNFMSVALSGLQVPAALGSNFGKAVCKAVYGDRKHGVVPDLSALATGLSVSLIILIFLRSFK